MDILSAVMPGTQVDSEDLLTRMQQRAARSASSLCHRKVRVLTSKKGEGGAELV